MNAAHDMRNTLIRAAEAARVARFVDTEPAESAAVAATDEGSPEESMWADEKANRWLVPGYIAALFGTVLVSHLCAKCSS